VSDVLDITPADIEPEPIEIEFCERCGCLFEDLEELIYLRAADMVTRLELADPRDAWRHTGETAPPASVRNSETRPGPRPYTTPQSTIDAFLFVARNHDAAYLARWLDDHPKDIATLTKLWETKNGLS
jgi:hypothetical protein